MRWVIAQRLFTFGQANAVFFRLWRNLKAAGRFSAVTAGKDLYKIARLNVRVGNRQRIFARLTGATAG